jgi:hypothetical protein
MKRRTSCPPYTCKTNGRTYKVKTNGTSRIPPRTEWTGRVQTTIGHYACFGCGGFCVSPFDPEGEYRPSTAEEIALVRAEILHTL